MLRVGIIGYGNRISHMAKALDVFGFPYRVAAIADPRNAEIEADNDPFLADTRFYESADEMLAHPDELDGVMVGTRCDLHTDMACKVAATGLPLFLEKPVAITFEQVKRLAESYRDVTTPTVVSFPLRMTPIVQTVKEIVESGRIGSVEQVVAFNDVPYGRVYYMSWYRNYEQNGGLWLQKATHDLDYITYLVGQQPSWVSAMKARRVFGGNKPFDLQCKVCDEREVCPESPFNRFRYGFEGERVNWELRERSYCAFSQGFELQDMGSCLIEYENGAQASYTQNFFARCKAARRGARLYGYEGTIEFDWYQNQIKLFRHNSSVIETIDFTSDMPHFGGDRELIFDFLMAMRDRSPSRSPVEAGILSALTCLWARESANTRQFCEVKMPAADGVLVQE